MVPRDRDDVVLGNLATQLFVQEDAARVVEEGLVLLRFNGRGQDERKSGDR
jgi:hypothetical protein